MTDIYYLDYSENFTGVYGTLSICTAEISPDDPVVPVFLLKPFGTGIYAYILYLY